VFEEDMEGREDECELGNYEIPGKNSGF